MIELLRQHGVRAGKSHKEMLIIYEDIKLQAKNKNLSGEKLTIFVNKCLDEIPDKVVPDSTPIKEIVIEAPQEALMNEADEPSKKSKSKEK